MSAVVTLKLTPAQFDLLRTAVDVAERFAENEAKDTTHSSPQDRQTARAQQARLGDLKRVISS